MAGTAENGVKVQTNVEITATIQFTEGQLRALDALVGYGDEAFLKAFYIKLGKHYMQPFERDLRDLFGRIRQTVPGALRGVEDARKALGIGAAALARKDGEPVNNSNEKEKA